MPILAAVALLALLMLAAIALLPLSLIQRYRVSTARRPARGWVAAVNIVGITISIGVFLVAAAVANIWVPNAFFYTLIGLAAGCLTGLLGLALTRWEATPHGLYYTPHRWLVLVITLIVTARVLYGFWRSWHLWNAGLDAWADAFGVAGSMGAGAVVLGYYLTYWFGVRRRMVRYRRSGRVR
jgi:hypothetical protein